MGAQYQQLSLEDRCAIASLHAQGGSLRQIAAALDRNPSTISREINRNITRQKGYQPAYAQDQSKARRWKGSRLDRSPELRELVLSHLKCRWSPEQIAGRLERDTGSPVITTRQFTASYMPNSPAPTTAHGATISRAQKPGAGTGATRVEALQTS
jgi:transposase, IS30 family